MRKPPVSMAAHWLVQRIEKERRKAGISQRGLSEACGMSPGWWIQTIGFGRIRGLDALERALHIFGLRLEVREDKGEAE